MGKNLTNCEVATQRSDTMERVLHRDGVFHLQTVRQNRQDISSVIQKAWLGSPTSCNTKWARRQGTPTAEGRIHSHSARWSGLGCQQYTHSEGKGAEGRFTHRLQGGAKPDVSRTLTAMDGD